MTAQALENASLTLTAQALTPEGPPTIAVDAVALTATALADLLQPTLVAMGLAVVLRPRLLKVAPARSCQQHCRTPACSTTWQQAALMA